MCRQTMAEQEAIEAEAVKRGLKLKVEVTDGSGFASNALRFTSMAEAVSYAEGLLDRWFAAKEYRVAIAED